LKVFIGEIYLVKQSAKVRLKRIFTANFVRIDQNPLSMLKWIITAIIVYALYQVFFRLTALKEAERRERLAEERERKSREDEYVDYEEVD
jgi:hypothetical protein